MFSPDFINAMKTFWIGLAAAALFSYPIYAWLKSNVKQKIDPFAPEGHQLKKGTPTMGGLMILAGALVPMLLTAMRAKDARPSWMFLLLLVTFGVIGFVDDFVIPRMLSGKRGLGWKQKFGLEILCGGIAAYMAFPAFNLQFALFLFLILFFSNAYNFADGLDGLSGSLWLGLTVGVVGLASYSRPDVALPMLAIAGAVVIFLFYNAPPAKIFMGDVGSLPLGAVLGAVVGLLYMPGAFDFKQISPIGFLPLAVFSFVMIAELVPVPMQVAYYKLTKGKRIFPATPIHHAFEKKGWPESRVVWAFALFQLLISLAAIWIACGDPLDRALF